MLVKFISFVITVFGTKRYKPLLLTFAALLVSLTGISAIAAFNTSNATPAASTTSAEEPDTQAKEVLTPQTPRKQSPRDDTASPTPQPSETPAGSTAANSTSSSGQTQAGQTAPTISLSTDKITLAKNASSDQVVAAISDNSQMEWSIMVSEAAAAELQVIPGNQTSANTRLTIKTNSTPAGQHNVTIQAKDVARGVTITKILTIIVTE